MEWGGELAAFANGQESNNAAVLLPTGSSAWIGLVADANTSTTKYLGQRLDWPQYWDVAAAAAANLSSTKRVNFVPSAGLKGRLMYATPIQYFDRPLGRTNWVMKATDCSCESGISCANCQVAGCTLLHSDGSWRGAACDGSLLTGAPLPAMCRRAAPASNECVLQHDTCDTAAECIDTPGSYICNCT